jgi:hypothetical protein
MDSSAAKREVNVPPGIVPMRGGRVDEAVDAR